MAYQKPFTLSQRREAIRAYRSYRKHYLYLRSHYPPVNEEQRRAIKAYRDAIHNRTDQLRKPDRAVNVVALSQADAWSKWTAMEYWRLYREL